jgi:hypothetical protein
MTASIIRIPVVYRDEPLPDSGTWFIEEEMKRVSDAAEDAQIAAEDFENDGKLDEAETALTLRDRLNARYAELRGQLGDVEGGW